MTELTKDNFEHEVLNEEGYVLVDFWGPSCEPCKALMPHIEEYSKEYGDRIKFTSLDISKARRLAIGQQIMGIPVVAIYKSGKKIDSLVQGAATKESVLEMIRKYV